MKQFGCIREFTEHRNEELMRAYRQAIAQSDIISLPEISEKIVNMPCDRFWVSEERAAIVISAMMRGKPILDTMRPTTREMFEEIYSRVMKIMKERPSADMKDIILEVVNSDAPKFYLQPRSAMETIYKIKKGFYDK